MPSPPPRRPTSMLPKFADATTTTIYCVHCRSCSSSALDCSDEAETPTHNKNTNTNIDTNTKTRTNPNNNLNRCSRCKVVHYCSKECQKLNYNFHKKRCKIIYKLRNEITEMKKENEEVGTEAEVEMEIEEAEEASLLKRYELSYIIFELGYMSTDTIERGKYIYQCSLVEYYKLFQIDFYATGVLESILLLLSILDDRNYDKYCISLIKYVLYNNDDNNDNNDIYNNSEFLCWDYGDITTSSSTFEISDYKKFRNLLSIRRHNNNNNKNGMFNPNPNMNPNIFFVPLMIIKMRQYADMTRTRNDHDNQSLLTFKKEIAELCYQIEYETNTNTSDNTGDYSTTEKVLPVMKSLFPDSDQHWGEEEVQMLLARRVTTTMTMTNDNQNNDNEWKKCCFLYWMLIKDCYAYTPGLLDAVEDIIIYMEESKESKSTDDVIPDDSIGNNDNDNDPSSESDDSEYISFINSMSSTAQEQQHKQQQQQEDDEEDENEDEDCKVEEDYHH